MCRNPRPASSTGRWIQLLRIGQPLFESRQRTPHARAASRIEREAFSIERDRPFVAQPADDRIRGRDLGEILRVDVVRARHVRQVAHLGVEKVGWPVTWIRHAPWDECGIHLEPRRYPGPRVEVGRVAQRQLVHRAQGLHELGDEQRRALALADHDDGHAVLKRPGHEAECRKVARFERAQ
eukprot:4505623-Prymnesium_polylepis.2